MNRTRAPAIHTTPIHKLPVEILSCIFLLLPANLCHNPPSGATDGNDSGKPVWHPDCLTQVCSRWRKVAVSLPFIWTHIDLTPDTSVGERFMDRAWTYAQRASGLPLDIHLDDEGCAGDDSYSLENIIQYMASCTRTLDFVISAPIWLDFHRSVLDSVLEELSPTVFQKLRMISNLPLPYSFLFPYDVFWTRPNEADGHELGPGTLRWKRDVINDRFSGVTTLHLRGIFFDWSNMIYHDLVDLRLDSPPTGRVLAIDALVLISILSKSRRMRIFHFSLQLTVPNEAGDNWLTKSGGPVPLPDLEVIQVSTTRTWHHAGILLSLLAPGSKPLRLTLEGTVADDFLRFGVDEFFARSRVERLCIRDGYFLVTELHDCHLPDLKVLVFDSCDNIRIEPVPISPSRWLSCWIHATKLDIFELRSMVKLCPTGLVLSACEVRRTLRFEEEELVVSEAELRAAFSTVQFLIGEGLCPNPTADWDVLD